MVPTDPKAGVVYFIAAAAGPGEPMYIKIGKTSGSAFARMRELQTGNPLQLGVLLTVPGYTDLEAQLHKRFAEYRIRGEWFSPGPKLCAYIDGGRAVGGPPVDMGEATDDDHLYGLSVDQIEAIRGYVLGMRIVAAKEELSYALDDYGDGTRPDSPFRDLSSTVSRINQRLAHGREDGDDDPRTTDPFAVGHQFGRRYGGEDELNEMIAQYEAIVDVEAAAYYAKKELAAKADAEAAAQQQEQPKGEVH